MCKMNIIRIVAFSLVLYACTKAESETCNIPLTSSLRDDQFLASSEYNTKHNASAARKDGEGWIASRGGKYEYLKIDLDSIFELTSLEVEGSNKGWYSRSFRISFSNDGYVWTGYNTRLSSDVMGEVFSRQGTLTKVTFDPIIKARYVVINPVTYVGYAALRIELYGCKSSEPLPTVSTNVRDGIEVNSTWIPNQSPILIHGNVVIRSPAVLTVQAGVKVIFTSETAYIDVYGTLSVDGIQGLSPLFSSNHPVLANRAKWQGIKQSAGGRIYMNHAMIRQAVTGLQGNGSSIKLDSCDIHSCTNGIRFAGGVAENVYDVGKLEENEIILLNVNVHDNRDGVITHGDFSKPFIAFAYSNFDRNDNSGVLVKNWDNSAVINILTNLYIINCSMSHNFDNGVEFTERINSNIIIANSTFVDNYRRGVYLYNYGYYYTFTSKTTLNVSYSHFANNQDTGITLYCYNCLSSDHTLHNNFFTGNGNQAVEVTLRMRSSDEISNLTITSNRFEKNKKTDIKIHMENNVSAYILNNYFAKSRTPVKLSGSTYSDTEFAYMYRNVFNEHTSNYGASVIEVNGVIATISNTTFSNSSLPTLVMFKDGLDHIFEYNRFVNTSLTTCFVRVDQTYDPTHTLTIDNNYWGTDDIYIIKTKICDFFIDSNKAIANVSNFYTTDSFGTRVSALDIDDLRAEERDGMNTTIIGGIIRSNLNLSSLGDTFIVNRSLLITNTANVNFKNVTVYFTSRRGIVVHGSLMIGDRNTKYPSILRSNSTNAVWNGIKLYSKEMIEIMDLELSGTQGFIDVKGNGSKIIFNNCNIVDHGDVVFADNLNGNLYIGIYNTSVQSRSRVIYIKANDSSEIYTEMQNSYVSSESQVIQFFEATSPRDIRLFSLHISNSSMYSRRNRIFSFSSCSSNFYGKIIGSKLYSSYYQDTAYFEFPSMNVNITGNTFGDSKNNLYINFCRQQKDSTYIYPRGIRISRNIFNSSRSGADIWIQKYYSDDRSHEINVNGNEFRYKSFVNRKRLYARGFYYTSNDKFSLDVDSNIFANSTDVAIYVENMFKRVSVTNNTFVNNSKCIHVKHSWTLFEFNITRNTFQNNTLAEGVIFLDTIINNNTNIIDNNFINNTNTAIAFTSPNTTIRYNSFENGKDVYNLKVLSEEYADKLVNASLNFWGTKDAKEISKTIYDKDFGDSLFDIEFRPYLGSNNKSDIQNEKLNFVSLNSEIGGSVNGEVTLTNDKSPYLVVSNVEVEASDILNIEPGVILVIKPDVRIKVYGEINILGAKANPVKMLAENVRKHWRGIDLRGENKSTILYLYVNNTEEGIQIQNSNINMQNITSNFARHSGITIDVTLWKQGHFKISEVTVENNGLDGINIAGLGVNNTEITLKKCIVANNLQYGINLETNATVYFENCMIEKNKESGIRLLQSDDAYVYINDSVLTGNAKYAITGALSGGIVITSSNITRHMLANYDRWGRLRSDFYIDLTESVNAKSKVSIKFYNVNFFENIAEGIRISKRYYVRSDMFIGVKNCTFAGGNQTIVIVDDNWRSTDEVNVTFVNNLIENNILPQKYNGYESHLMKMTFANSFHVNFNGNIFRNNIANTGLYMFVSTTFINGNASILENIFFNNNFSTSTIDISKQLHLRLHKNVFRPVEGNDCILVAPRLNISYTIDATFNFWGSGSTNQVAKSVCGFEKDMSKSFIRYVPFFADITLDRIISADPNALNLSGTFGGEITGDVTISRTDFPTPVRVDRSILIREGSSLHIEAGLVLQFEKNRGIYVQGSLNILGGESPIVLESAQETTSWSGVIVKYVLDSHASKTIIYNARFHKMAIGIVLHSENVDIKKSQIVDSSGHCLTIYQGLELSSYDFEMSRIDNCSKNGIYIVGDGNIALKNIAINGTQVGVGLNAKYGLVEISHVNISESLQEALTISFTDSSRSGNVSVHNCFISSCVKGIKVRAQTSRDNNLINFYRNTFVNIPNKAFDISPYNRYYQNNIVNRTVIVNLNSFTNSCGISLETWNSVNVTLSDNIFKDAVCFDVEDTCFFHALSHGYSIDTNYRQYHISTNMFQNITCKCLVKLDDGDRSVTGDFVYNQLLDITASDTVVLSNALNVNMSWNIFDNPQSTFDLYAKKRGQGTVNATNNWWGSSDASRVYNRIFDKRRDQYLITFNVTPVMTKRVIDCTGVNNCSNHGECVSPNRCRCNSGWTGKLCNDYDCAGANYCYGNGDCTAPNTCKCNEGWSGPLCIVASCSLVNSCSGNGVCFRPNVCTCAARFMGGDCSTCVPLHWGLQCEPCPDCQHGKCNLTSGTCECDDKNWTGYLCDKCSKAFYGPECLPLMKLLDIVPKMGLDKGQNSVHVWGHNFPNTSTGSYVCKFGTTQTIGTWLAWNHVVCPAPKMTQGTVYLEISPDGVKFTNDKVIYYFYAACPPGSCGRDDNPPRGQCIFGGCSCFLPYRGDNCEKELLGPVISGPILHATLVEGALYSVQLNLTQGSPPLLWSLMQGPAGMTVDDSTGMMQWKHVTAKSSVYTIKVKATNLVGHDSITWNITIPLSYTVSIDKLDTLNSAFLPVPTQVGIYGNVSFSNKDVVRVVPIDISIISDRTGREVLIQELSNPLSPTTFKVTYYPRPDDAGVFIVRARHPGANSYMSSNFTWSVLGMRCEPISVFVSEKITADDGMVTVKNISSLRNIGNGVISEISARIDGLPEAYVRISGDTGSSQFDLSSIAEAEVVDFDLVIRNAKPLSGTIYVVFSAETGTSTRLRINIKLSIRKPLLIFDPPFLRENIVRGSIRVFDIKMNNSGEVAGTNVIVSLPKDPRMSLVSLSSSSSDKMDSSSNVNVPPGDVALISIAITTEKTESLGEMSGTIYINTALSSTPFSYRFVITSLERFNITFIVKDEYTYFAADSPLVSNAMVKLVNPRRGFSETKYTTNETGYVTFENVYEDMYSLYAEAEGHLTYAEVILVSSDTTEQDIFLQRVAVKYTWSVEPTTVKDVYVIQLESTFETHVPMPVVTIQPAKVNTIPYELEEDDTIDFNITNHGLIRADNVRFNLPTGHPYLKFETTVDFIGSVEANTSVIVKVKATLKNRVRRNVFAQAVCGLALLYDFICGGTQTRLLDVTLTREYPGRPPFPCGLGGGDSRGGGGVSYEGVGPGSRTGRGSSMNYNPTTPLSCNCAKTLIKGCALAFHPVAGCALAVTDVGTSYSRSNGDLIVGTENFLLGLLDTAFACVIGVKYTIPGIVYTTIRCVMDASDDCGRDRRRREVSSDVVDNLLSTAEPIDNFLTMLTEILGDREMYNFDNSAWYQTFKKSVGEDGELGIMLSKTEATSVLNTLVDEESKANLTLFLERWNNTAAARENGTLNELSDTSRVIRLTRLSPRIEQYLIDVESAADRGFDSIFDEFGHAKNAYQAAEQNEVSSGGSSQKDDGVCARVRVRIIQELVLTRDAFNAKLEIENGESSDLESIHVEIYIKETFGSGELANDKFSIGTPSLIGLSGVDGSGTLGKDLSGSAEWLIIPYSVAAPEEETQYDIGGRLSYSVDGSDFSVPLLPDTINVKSNPSLVVHYFHEKYVQGDNALTPEKEPIVPFSLAVMVMNNGYGVARSLKITSGQPEIIENEKGLLVTFKIIGAQIGKAPIFPSLAVNFGDISSFETKTARWLMTSTLMGTFYNYSASFENINPLGDPQLSLLDELGYHELVHLVRIDIPTHDDGIDDFLVNDIIDNEGIPDRLYDSKNGSNVLNVYTANFTNVKVITYDSRKSYKFVTLTLKTNSSTWFYARIENTFISPDPKMKESLLYAHHFNNGRELIVDKNVWQTTHINNTFYLHLLDYVENNSTNTSISEKDIDYVLIYGPQNMYAPRFNSTTYSVTISRLRAVGSEIITIHAYDIDKDNISFRFGKNYTEYDIKPNSEMSTLITVKVSPLKVGQVILEVIAEDSGIPSKSAHINLTVTITDMAITDSTPTTHFTDFSNPITTEGQSTISSDPSEVSRTATARPTIYNKTKLTTTGAMFSTGEDNGVTTVSTARPTFYNKTKLTTTGAMFSTGEDNGVTTVSTARPTFYNKTKLTTTGAMSSTREDNGVTTVSTAQSTIYNKTKLTTTGAMSSTGEDNGVTTVSTAQSTIYNKTKLTTTGAMSSTGEDNEVTTVSTAQSTIYNKTKLTTTGAVSSTRGGNEVTTVSSTFKVDAEIILIFLVLFVNLL